MFERFRSYWVSPVRPTKLIWLIPISTLALGTYAGPLDLLEVLRDPFMPTPASVSSNLECAGLLFTLNCISH